MEIILNQDPSEKITGAKIKEASLLLKLLLNKRKKKV
tara:strand:+ start:593 stop:703 length:111 start_codon:yes stop_codon:yes gene_type:complete